MPLTTQCGGSRDLFIGVDTHKKTHTFVGINDHGQTCGTRSVANSPQGWATALRWAREHDDECCWGIENTGSLGKGFAQFLLAHGETDVREVSPQRTAQYRRRGRTQDKTDTTDARAIARLLRAEGKQLPLVQADDASTERRLLSDHRDNLVAERTRLVNQLHAQMLQIDPCYAERSGALTSRTGVRYCRDLELADADGVLQTRLLIVRQLTNQLLRLWEEIEIIETTLRQRVAATGTPLLQLCGVGTIVAARLIGELGCVPRIHSAAALASLAGIAPVAVSSGGRHGYRLNRGGNRQLNRVFHMIALSQLRREPLAQAYYAKKRAEGKTARSALRCLKRRLVDVVYRLLPTNKPAVLELSMRSAA
ncbi:MAG: IS110 family transposase [Chloroflexota bacterium]|nr:IS110 family transposase [Chloroflexota bacterium]